LFPILCFQLERYSEIEKTPRTICAPYNKKWMFASRTPLRGQGRG
jgi:hypothetical protein